VSVFRGPSDRSYVPPPDTARFDGGWWRCGSLDDRYQVYRETELAAGREPVGFVYWSNHREYFD
jgi:hypothetical protein